MKDKNLFKANEAVTAGALNSLVQDSQIAQGMGNATDMVMSQRAVTASIKSAMGPDSVLMPSSDYEIDNNAGIATPIDKGLVHGKNYFLQFENGSSFSEFGVSFSNPVIDSLIDDNPSYAIQIANVSNKYAYIMLCAHIRRCERISYSPYLAVIDGRGWTMKKRTDRVVYKSYKDNIVTGECDELRVIRKRSYNGNYFIYTFMLNGITQFDYSDTDNILGDKIEVSIGGKGCKADLVNWFCEPSLLTMAKNSANAICDVVFDSSNATLTFIKNDGSKQVIELGSILNTVESNS